MLHELFSISRLNNEKSHTLIFLKNFDRLDFVKVKPASNQAFTKPQLARKIWQKKAGVMDMLLNSKLAYSIVTKDSIAIMNGRTVCDRERKRDGKEG